METPVATEDPKGEAQEPANRQAPNLNLSTKITVATLNVPGLKQAGKREEIQNWMHDNKFDVLCLQETHISLSTTEKGKTTLGTLLAQTNQIGNLREWEWS